MDQLLLVILLSLDPAAKPDADAVRERLTEAASAVQANIKIISGTEATAALKEHGLTEGDLMSGVGVGNSLTKSDPSLAVIRLDRRISGGDVVVETRIWATGHEDNLVAISGRKTKDAPPAEPSDAVGRGVRTTLGLWLSAHGKADASSAGLTRLATLADQREWRELVLAAAALPPSPRQAYYQILGLVRTDRREEAITALEALKAAYPKHILTASAEGLIAPKSTADGGEVDINNQTIQTTIRTS